jgi:hypothetical protein
MAFNPFTWFRKHQKVFFAGLTIVCMLVFVGQVGVGADIFYTMLSWVGAARQRGDVVTTLYGKKVTETDLHRLEQRRRLANDYVLRVVDAHQRFRAADDLLKSRELKDLEPTSPLGGLRTSVESAQRYFQTLQQLSMQRGQDPGRVLGLLLQFAEGDLQRVHDVVARNRKAFEDPDNLALAERAATIIGYKIWEFRRKRDDLYFGGGLKTADLLDFLVWKQQADRLGIVLSDADVLKEISREAASPDLFEGKKFDEDSLVRSLLGEGQRQGRRREQSTLKAEDLLNAIRDEFRVAMAQGILLGEEPGARAARGQLGLLRSPASAAPDEFFQYYKRNRTTVRAKLLRIPVANFVADVTASPTEEELRNRYERYKEQEPAPDRREPGFKEPRRVLVEYVSASPDEPYYREEGRKAAAVVEALCRPPVLAATRLTAPLHGGSVGAGPLGWAAAVAAPLAFDPVGAEYERALKDQPSWLEPSFGSSSLRLHDVSVWRPANVASALGQLFGASVGRGNALSAPVALVAGGAAAEFRDGLRFTGAMLLGGGSAPPPLPHIPSLAGSAALAVPFLPGTFTREQMHPQLMARVEKDFAESLVRKNLDTMRLELAKLKGQGQKAADYVQKAVKDYHLKFYTMPPDPGPVDQATLADSLKRKVDLNLGELRDAWMKAAGLMRRRDFIASLFRDPPGAYDAELLPTESGRWFLSWRSVDKPAHVRPFSAVRAQAEEAWRFERARNLTWDYAVALEKKINDARLDPSDAERLLREQVAPQPSQGAKGGPKKGTELFELDNVALLVPPEREVHAAARTEYRRYELPESRSADFPYPPDDLAKQLVALERGDAAVVIDRPARNYYVAVLFDRDVPNVKSFRELYKKTPRQDSLYDLFLGERREEYRRALLGQLRREAGKVDKQGQFEIPDAVRRRDSGQRGEEE